MSVVSGVKCDKCGGSLDVPIMAVGAKGKREEGVFVRAEGRFTVGDDLTVRPASLGESFGLASRLGIDDGSELEEKVVKVGEEEILRLLKRSLVSRTALTDVFLQEPEIININEKSVVTDITQARINKKNKSIASKRINVKLYLSAENDKVVYAEAGKDLVDLLFSFLTFPLGSVIKLLGKHSSMGCIDNLYSSAELLSSDFGYMKSEDCKNMLLAPMLPPHFGSRHQLLNIDEVSPQKIRTCAFQTCDAPVYANRCPHGMHYEEMNPRKQNSGLGTGEGYARGMVKFMVTDEMEVKPLSPISGFNIIKKLMVPISSLEEAEASLGEVEALNLLKTILISHTVLSDVFSPYPMTLFEENWCGRLSGKCNGVLD